MPHVGVPKSLSTELVDPRDVILHPTRCSMPRASLPLKLTPKTNLLRFFFRMISRDSVAKLETGMLTLSAAES